MCLSVGRRTFLIGPKVVGRAVAAPEIELCKQIILQFIANLLL